MVTKTKDHLTRQRDLIPEKVLTVPVTIIGAGATGSWSALLLTKMGMSNINIFDFDDVEVENMNAQFYKIDDISSSKVSSLKSNIQNFTGTEINAVNEKFENFPPKTKIVISAVDNMASRVMIWEKCKEAKIPFFIDPRMAIETCLIYAMKPTNRKDIESYQKTLYSDEDAVQERCTAKSTVYTANLIAGQVCKIVKDYITDKPYTRVLNWDIASNTMQAFSSQ